MKKARILLAAVAVLAIGGTALAVKSQKAVGSLVYLAPGANQAATETSIATITATGFPGATQTWATPVYNATNASFTYVLDRD